MQPEEILKLLESNDKAMRLEGVSAYFEFLIPPKDDDSNLEEEEIIISQLIDILNCGKQFGEGPGITMKQME